MDSSPRSRSTFALQAIALTLAVHATVLGGMVWWDLASPKAQVRYAEVGLLEEPMEWVAPRSMEEELRAAMEGRIANVRSDASKSRVAERVNSGSQAMREAVEAELRAFEAAEMARLAAEEKDFGLEGVPKVDDREVETLTGWDAQYDGDVTVTYDVPGRRAKKLDVPGYRCQGGAKVVIAVEVTRAGEVRSAEVIGDLALELEDCFVQAALQSARRSTFYIDNETRSVTRGTLTYRFVPQ
jgi:hypothetical protein